MLEATTASSRRIALPDGSEAESFEMDDGGTAAGRAEAGQEAATEWIAEGAAFEDGVGRLAAGKAFPPFLLPHSPFDSTTCGHGCQPSANDGSRRQAGAASPGTECSRRRRSSKVGEIPPQADGCGWRFRELTYRLVSPDNVLPQASRRPPPSP